MYLIFPNLHDEFATVKTKSFKSFLLYDVANDYSRVTLCPSLNSDTTTGM